MEVLNPSNNIQTQRGFNDFWQSCCLFLKQVLAPTYKRNMHPTHKRKLSPLLQGRNRISSENSNLSCPKSLCCGRTQTYINHESVCKLVWEGTLDRFARDLLEELHENNTSAPTGPESTHLHRLLNAALAICSSSIGSSHVVFIFSKTLRNQ